MNDLNMTPFKNLMANTYIAAQKECVSKLKYHLQRVNRISRANRECPETARVLHDMGLDVDDLPYETQQLSRWLWVFQVMLDETGEVKNYRGDMIPLGIERAFKYCADRNLVARLDGLKQPYPSAVVEANKRAYAELQGVEAEAAIPKGFYDFIIDMATDSNKLLKGFTQTDTVKEQITLNDEALAACGV